MELLEAGVHLLVEKPLCATPAEADELVDAARRRNAGPPGGARRTVQSGLHRRRARIVRNPKYIEAVRASGFTFRSTDVGVVLDLMIHDIDLVLSLVRSPVRRVEALGLSVLGGHEDVANARLEFECGCVATLSASRVSYEQVRRMHVWSPRAFAGIDFATRTTTLVRPSETLLRRAVPRRSTSRPSKSSTTRSTWPKSTCRGSRSGSTRSMPWPWNSHDFVEAIRTPRQPRVTGEAGRDAVAVAEQILDRIDAHAWDDAPTARSARWPCRVRE